MTERDEDTLREWKEQRKILNDYFGEDAILESGEEGE